MDFSKLYREVIVDHYKNPRFKGLTGKYPQCHLRNPSCGDDITVETGIENGRIVHVRHAGSGCSICCASASVMCELLNGKAVPEAQALVASYYAMISGRPYEPENLGEALAFQNICDFPARTKCALIAWQALEEAAEWKEHE